MAARTSPSRPGGASTTISSMPALARNASMLQPSMGRPASGMSAFGSRRPSGLRRRRRRRSRTNWANPLLRLRPLRGVGGRRMMSGPMSTTANIDGGPVTRLPDRARWLASLTDAQREMLPDMSLREVDERFARWLEAERPDGGGRRGEPPHGHLRVGLPRVEAGLLPARACPSGTSCPLRRGAERVRDQRDLLPPPVRGDRDALGGREPRPASVSPSRPIGASRTRGPCRPPRGATTSSSASSSRSPAWATGSARCCSSSRPRAAATTARWPTCWRACRGAAGGTGVPPRVVGGPGGRRPHRGPGGTVCVSRPRGACSSGCRPGRWPTCACAARVLGRGPRRLARLLEREAAARPVLRLRQARGGARGRPQRRPRHGPVDRAPGGGRLGRGRQSSVRHPGEDHLPRRALEHAGDLDRDLLPTAARPPSTTIIVPSWR